MNAFTALGIVFIVLKLLGAVTWSWWLVLLPFYGGFVVLFGLSLVWAWLAAVPSSVRRRRL